MIEAVIDPPTLAPPRRIVLRLRHPDEKPIRSVTLDGREHRDFDPKAETISLPPAAGRMMLRVNY